MLTGCDQFYCDLILIYGFVFYRFVLNEMISFALNSESCFSNDIKVKNLEMVKPNRIG
jgi:hypothetical protein